MIDLLVGYGIGTAQIVVLKWFRGRAAHRRDLRLLRTELLRLRAFDAKYHWTLARAPASNVIPKPPSLSSTFQPLVARLDWRLTDEHADDDSDLSAITIGDLCDTMQRYHKSIEDLVAKAESAEASEAGGHLEHAVEIAEKYDLEVDQFLYVIDDALDNVRQRLRRAGLFPQLRRVFVRLKHGTNPTPVSPTDPRVREAAARRELPGEDRLPPSSVA